MPHTYEANVKKINASYLRSKCEENKHDMGVAL